MNLKFFSILSMLLLLLWASFTVVHNKAVHSWLKMELIDIAWARTLAGEGAVKPWPGAPGGPVARIAVARLNENFTVFRGTSGAVLAIAPGWNEGTDAPGAPGISLITGQSATDFEFLRDLREGDLVSVQTVDGVYVDYVIEDVRIVLEAETKIERREDESVLLLSAWLPFANWQPDGARLVAVARALDDPEKDTTS